MSIEIVNTLPEEDWRRFIEEHPDGNIFHTPEMFQVFGHSKGHKPKLWAATQNGRILVLFLPVDVNLWNGILRPLTTRAISYGSVLCVPGKEGQEALGQLLHTYKCRTAGEALFTELRNQSDLGLYQGVLESNGFVFEDHLNYIIDLSKPIEEIWKCLHPGARTNIRKAHKNRVDIQEVTTADKIPDVYSVLYKVYKHIRVPLAHLSLFEAAFEILFPRGMIKFFTAQVDNACIGTAVRLLYKDTIYDWYAGVLRDNNSYKAHDLLNWHVFDWGNHNGFCRFDFGGAGKPNQDYGPRDFKAKFGGTLVNYGRYMYVHHPGLFLVSEWGYQMSRRLNSESMIGK